MPHCSASRRKWSCFNKLLAAMFDFDNPPSRAGTCAVKYTSRARLFGREDVMPFWVADMEFATAPAIREALETRCRHPIYGYTSVSDALLEAIAGWNRKRYDLTCDGEEITIVPGVMPGVSAALYALSEPGDGVVVQPPLYPPLMDTVRRTRRLLLENPLVRTDGSYRIDFEGLEHFLQVHQPRIMLFCSPHNPVGRVWSREEVARIAALARRYQVYLVSDEIHADIVFPPHRHVSALSAAGEDNNRIIVLNAASKSFNVAGLNTAYAIIPDKTVRAAFRRQLRWMNLHGANIFGMSALEAAYGRSEEWLESLLIYLQANRDYMKERLAGGLPGLRYFIPEGTYLYWLDFNSPGLTPGEIRKKLIDNAGVGLNDGVTFSPAHEGFWRFNFAVPRSMLEQGLDRIIAAFRHP
ncbi:MAG: PatB family C-S lyase [Desulfobulbaceae bacterium]|nr:PatB family C-S lyase [Desulfobulbaceae bacterium]